MGDVSPDKFRLVIKVSLVMCILQDINGIYPVGVQVSIAIREKSPFE
jgi:hypothetical protein